MKNKLAAIAALLLFTGITSAQGQRSTFRIRFHETRGRIILDMKLDGKPAALLFDTGAAMSFSLVRSGRPLIMVFHHSELQFETAAPDERCPTVAEPDVRVQGFVGTDVLKRFRAIRIDYENQVLELEE